MSKIQALPANLAALGMLQQVVFTNLTFGKPTLSLDDPDYWKKLKSQWDLVVSEVQETLDDGINERSLKGLRDGIADILVTALGLAHLAGFDADDDMREVFKSNLSKVCPTEEDAQLTSRKYWDIGIETVIEPCTTIPGFIVKVKGDQTDDDGKFYPNGKFLKSVGNFHEPVFFWDEEALAYENSAKFP